MQFVGKTETNGWELYIHILNFCYPQLSSALVSDHVLLCAPTHTLDQSNHYNVSTNFPRSFYNVFKNDKIHLERPA